METAVKKVSKTTKKKSVKPASSKKASVDKKNVKTTKKQIVESEREVKYNYPDDVKGPIDRKSWRQKVRSKLRNLEAALGKAKSNKDKGLASKELKAYQEEVLLVP